MKEVTLVLTVYNNMKMVGECLASLVSTHEEYPFKLVIVDNNSDAETKALLSRFDTNYDYATIVYLEQNRYIGAGENVGVEKSGTKYIGMIHADMTFPNKKWLSDAMSMLRKNSMVFFHQIHPITNNTTYAFCFVCERKTFMDIKEDERYKIGCMDWDFFHRLMKTNPKCKIIMCKGASVFHETCVVRKRVPKAAQLEREDRDLYFKLWKTHSCPNLPHINLTMQD